VRTRVEAVWLTVGAILIILGAITLCHGQTDEDISKLSWGEIQATVKHIVQLAKDQKIDLDKANGQLTELQTQVGTLQGERDAWKDAEKNSEIKIVSQSKTILIQWGIISLIVGGIGVYVYLKGLIPV